MILDTARLELHAFTTADAPFIVELLNTPAWLKNIGDRNVRTIQDAENYLLNGTIKSYNEHGFGFWKVTLKELDAPIGMCGLVKREGLDDIDLGFAFLPEHEGKGYGFEIASAVLNYVEAEYGIKKLVAITSTSNEPSIRLLEKLGFAFEKMVKLPKDDEELKLFRLESHLSESC